MEKYTLDEWIVFGDTGQSSITMWAAIKRIDREINNGRYFSYPYDNSDFGRCYKFYKQCSLTKVDLQKVADVFKWWKPFISCWDRLADAYERQCVEELYLLIKQCRSKSDKIIKSMPCTISNNGCTIKWI